MYDFNYHRPESIDQAKALFADHEDSIYLAGGHTLIPSMKQRLSAPSDVIDLSAIAALNEISVDDGVLRIGALATHDSVATSALVSAHCSAIADLAGGIGDAQVRNRGTIGGSIANNDPAADYPAAIVGLNATVHTDQRNIEAADFFTGMFETALQDGEIITAVSFPGCSAAAYAKFPNPASRYATVGVLVAKTDDGVRVAITGASPCVFRANEMEAALEQNFSANSLDSITLDQDSLMSDMHASAEYRVQLCKVMAKRAVDSLI
jgi:carbon-monoxide dehydrogenase medium subunit